VPIAGGSRPSSTEADHARRHNRVIDLLTVVSALLGLLLVVGMLAGAVRLLRQRTPRYLGDPTPGERRSFRETMTVWLMGPRN
jgi:hypothetical protein